MPSSVIVGILGLIGAFITGIITFISGRNASVAVLQTALTEGFRELQRQQDAVIIHLKDEIHTLQEKVQVLEGKLAAEEQRTISLKNLLRRNGISIPRETRTKTVIQVVSSDAELNAALDGDSA